MAVKKSGKPGSKKTVKTNSKKSTLKNSSKKSSGKNTGKQKKINIDKTPVYVLSIMTLFTVIILLVNNSINKPDKKNILNNGKAALSGKNENVNFQSQQDKRNVDKEPVMHTIKKETEVKEKQFPVQTDIRQEYYIYLVKFDRNSESMSLAPVKRNVKSGAPLADTLKELIKGPNTREKKRGLLTAVPAELRIREIKVEGRNAVLDFDNSIEENADGQILLTRIDQLVYTATQFEGIDGVIIKVNGRRKEFLGGEGLSISKPIGRRNQH